MTKKNDNDPLAITITNLLKEYCHGGTNTKGILGMVLERVEREVLEYFLENHQGTKVELAEKLGINRNTLTKKISQYHLEQ